MRRLKRVCKVLLFLLVSLVAVHGAITLVLGWMVQREIAKLRARGEPVSIRDLRAPRVPDSENAAPLYCQASAVALECLNRYRGSAPPGPMPDDMPDIPDARTQRAIRDDRSQVIRLLEQGLARPRCQFGDGIRHGEITGPSECDQTLPAVELLLTDARAAARDGDLATAARDIELAIRVTDSLRRGQALLKRGFRLWLMGRISETLRSTLRLHSLTGAQSESMGKALTLFDASAGAADEVREWRAVGISGYKDFGASRIYIDVWSDSEVKLFRSYLWRPCLYADELFLLRGTREHLASVRVPYRVLRRQGPDWDRRHYPWYARWAPLVLIEPGYRLRERDYAAGQIALCRTALALCDYRSRFGKYPPTLNELRERLGWRIPNDPFSGKPFVYKRTRQCCELRGSSAELREKRLLGSDHSGDRETVWRLAL